MIKAITHAKLDNGVVKTATECNQHYEGEDSKAINCKLENMKALERALHEKKEHAEDNHKQAHKDLSKVQLELKELEGKHDKQKAQEKKEEKEHKEAVDKATQQRMKELEGCERSKIQADMDAKRECQKQAKAERLRKMRE